MGGDDSAGRSDAELWPSWSRGEIGFALLCAALLALLTSIPVLDAVRQSAQRGREWTGAGIFGPADLGVYLSSLRQASHGVLAFRNEFTTEAGPPVVNVFWFAIGQLARIPGVSLVGAYQIARVLLLLPLVLTCSWSVSRLLSRADERRVALVLLLFGAGIGGWLQPMLYRQALVAWPMASPVDLWVPESNVFVSAMYSPHMVASWTLLVLAITSALTGARTGAMRSWIVGGVAALVLFQFHPFYVPMVWGITAVFAAWTARRDGWRTRSLRGPLVLVLLSAPSAAYHIRMVLFSANRAWLLGTNQLPTPNAAFVVVGFLGFIVCAVPGLRALARRGGEQQRRAALAAVWVVVACVAIYAPVSFQRRLLEGLLLPLAVLSAPFVVRVWELATLSPLAMARPVVVVLGAVTFLSSAVDAAVRSVQETRANAQDVFFRDPADTEALAWMADSLPADAVVLARAVNGYAIAGWAGRRVYLGHWANTVAVTEKVAEVGRFFAMRDDAARAAFLARRGITHVFVGPAEREAGAVMLERSGVVRVVYERGERVVYAVVERKKSER